MKILIVEDEKALSGALHDKFTALGYEVKAVLEGGSAYQEAKSFLPDIILLDILLPRKNGFQVLQELKADPDIKNIPVIMLSNLDTDEDIKKSLQLGAVDYFVKSNHPIKEVVEKVKEQLLKAK